VILFKAADQTKKSQKKERKQQDSQGIFSNKKNNPNNISGHLHYVAKKLFFFLSDVLFILIAFNITFYSGFTLIVGEF